MADLPVETLVEYLALRFHEVKGYPALGHKDSPCNMHLGEGRTQPSPHRLQGLLDTIATVITAVPGNPAAVAASIIPGADGILNTTIYIRLNSSNRQTEQDTTDYMRDILSVLKCNLSKNPVQGSPRPSDSSITELILDLIQRVHRFCWPRFEKRATVNIKTTWFEDIEKFIKETESLSEDDRAAYNTIVDAIAVAQDIGTISKESFGEFNSKILYGVYCHLLASDVLPSKDGDTGYGMLTRLDDLLGEPLLSAISLSPSLM